MNAGSRWLPAAKKSNGFGAVNCGSASWSGASTSVQCAFAAALAGGAWNLEWRGPQFEIETQPRANSDLDSRALLQLQQRGNQWCIESTGVQFFFSFGVLERD
jgi:hypothetical protein